MNKKELKEIKQAILEEEKDGKGLVCEENARYRAYVNLKLKKQKKVKKGPAVTCIKCGGWAYEGTDYIICGDCNKPERYCKCKRKRDKDE